MAESQPVVLIPGTPGYLHFTRRAPDGQPGLVGQVPELDLAAPQHGVGAVSKVGRWNLV